MLNRTPFSTEYTHECELTIHDGAGGCLRVYDPEATFVIEGNDVEGYGATLTALKVAGTARWDARGAVDTFGAQAVYEEECRALDAWMEAEGVTLEPERWAMGA